MFKIDITIQMIHAFSKSQNTCIKRCQDTFFKQISSISRGEKQGRCLAILRRIQETSMLFWRLIDRKLSQRRRLLMKRKQWSQSLKKGRRMHQNMWNRRLRARKEQLSVDPLEICFIGTMLEKHGSEEVQEVVRYLDGIKPLEKSINSKIGVLGYIPKPLKPSAEEPPTLELKPLPSHLKYLYLLKNDILPVICSSSLTGCEEENLLRVIREHIRAIGWSLANIKGISPSMCMHKILMEAEHKTPTQPQRRLNPAMQEVVKKEVIKLLDADIIYPISDSE